MSRSTLTHTQIIEPRWVSIAQVATYADVTERTVRRWLADGTLQGYRVGAKLVRLDINDVDAMFRAIPNAKTAA